jgi:hypothetical protein
MNAYKYIYRNPVRAGLCERVEDYPFSTISGLVGNSRLLFPVVEDTLLFNPTFQWSTLDWLNTAPKDGHEEQIRKALKRSVFTFSPVGERPSELETLLL